MQKKFSETLSHRDYLGAILNLGLERSKIGDIVVQDDFAILFVHQSLESFVQDELKRIRHTSVITEVENFQDFSYSPKIEEKKGTVSSLRLDSLLALAFSSSRTKLVAYIENGKVFVNGKLITSNGYQIKDSDIISVRGLGRFQYKGMVSQTKKSRYFVTIHLYNEKGEFYGKENKLLSWLFIGNFKCDCSNFFGSVHKVTCSETFKGSEAY